MSRRPHALHAHRVSGGEARTLRGGQRLAHPEHGTHPGRLLGIVSSWTRLPHAQARDPALDVAIGDRPFAQQPLLGANDQLDVTAAGIDIGRELNAGLMRFNEVGVLRAFNPCLHHTDNYEDAMSSPNSITICRQN